ncbi:hypothetical protein [Actinomycetospora aeridis]|uniref:Excreted virulence factor EspC (Type VII ESX diderm) n=1 Tax=Actinomycetospora aeridis TaxID=3129231 RepID=A0ABU8N677_9PSEU
MTVPPAPDGPDDLVDVGLQALRDDAAIWQGARARLEAVRGPVAQTEITPAAFSMWAVDAGLDRAYADLRARMDAVIEQGTGAFGSIGDALTTAAETYGREDAANAAEFRELQGGGR